MFAVGRIVLVSVLLLISSIECYQPGYSYKYEYETKVEMFTPKNRTKQASVFITQAEFELERDEAGLLYGLKFSSFHEASQLFTPETKIRILSDVFHFEYDSDRGQAGNVYARDAIEAKGSLIFMKSVIDLLNFDLESKVCDFI
jgi:hypothetical protein